MVYKKKFNHTKYKTIKKENLFSKEIIHHSEKKPLDEVKKAVAHIAHFLTK